VIEERIAQRKQRVAKGDIEKRVSGIDQERETRLNKSAMMGSTSEGAFKRYIQIQCGHTENKLEGWNCGGLSHGEKGKKG
jgi:hypothetical protein